MTNLYEVLGLTEAASQEEIKKAYRKLSLQFHPDKTGGTTVEKFQKINEAYETLGDEEKRQQYDMTQTKTNISINNIITEEPYWSK